MEAILKYILWLKDSLDFVASYQQEQIAPAGPTLL